MYVQNRLTVGKVKTADFEVFAPNAMIRGTEDDSDLFSLMLERDDIHDSSWMVPELSRLMWQQKRLEQDRFSIVLYHFAFGWQRVGDASFFLKPSLSNSQKLGAESPLLVHQLKRQVNT